MHYIGFLIAFILYFTANLNAVVYDVFSDTNNIYYSTLNNFTNRNIRPKLTALNYLLSNLLTAGISLSCSWLLSITTTANTFMIIGCVTTIVAVLLLDYMRGRVGLKPDQYSKEDLKYSTYKPQKKA